MFNIVKASGKIETFEPEKLKLSLIRSGATQEEADEISSKITSKIKELMTTKQIYSLAHKLLRKYSIKSYMRYSLKKAMLKLGPAGYTFERYFADLLNEYGYRTKVDIVLKGRCIKHEVDVLAIKDNKVITVECKYHSTQERTSDAKVALYINSRFKDLESRVKNMYRAKNYEGWLVTNTRFSIDAINYAKCENFTAISWRYPEDGGLEKMIEEKRLYPVTILSGIKANLSKKLISKGIILVRDITLKKEDELQSMLKLSSSQAKKLKKHAIELCNNDKVV